MKTVLTAGFLAGLALESVCAETLSQQVARSCVKHQQGTGITYVDDVLSYQHRSDVKACFMLLKNPAVQVSVVVPLGPDRIPDYSSSGASLVITELRPEGVRTYSDWGLRDTLSGVSEVDLFNKNSAIPTGKEILLNDKIRPVLEKQYRSFLRSIRQQYR